MPLSMMAYAAALTGDVKNVDGNGLVFGGLGVTAWLNGIDGPERRKACESANGKRYECSRRILRRKVHKPERLAVEQGMRKARRRYCEQYVLQEK